MFKTALTSALVLGTVSAALATEFDANLGNRYPGFTGTALQSAPVALQGRNQVLINDAKSFDRVGASYDNGVN